MWQSLLNREWQKPFQGREDSEHIQALIRCAYMSLLSIAYFGSRALGWIPRIEDDIPIAAPLLATLVSAGLVLAIWRHPKKSHLRRLIGMCVDYCTIAIAMHTGGESVSALYVILLWVTIGNGVRYGPQYLRLSVAIAVFVFIGVILTTPFWRQIPALSWGLAVGFLMIPLYLNALLEALTSAKEKAVRASLAKSQFVANVSHELRTPLNGVIAISELLQTTPLNREQQQYTDILRNASEALLSQVNSVLDFSAIEAGKIVLNEECFSPQAVIENVILLQKNGAEAKSLVLCAQASPEVPAEVVGDMPHVRQILINLINNAIKFTPKGHVKVGVTRITGDPSKVTLRFFVEDTGIGIPENARRRVLEPFEQVDARFSRQYGGVGLGMSIVVSLVRHLKGRLEIESTENRGTRVLVDIPFDTVEVTGTSNSNIIRLDDPFLLHRAKVQAMRFAVVDDQETNRFVLRSILEKAGHSCICLASSEELLQQLESTYFDGIFVDLHMPGTSGIELIHFVRILETGSARTPIIVVSADVTTATREKLVDSGVTTCLSKPLNANAVLECVRGLARGGEQGDRIANAGRSEGKEKEHALDSAIHRDMFDDGIDISQILILIEKTSRDLRTCSLRFIQAMSSGHGEIARDEAHAIQGLAAYLGAKRLVRWCEKVRSLSGREIQTPNVIARMKADLEMELLTIDDELPKLFRTVESFGKVSKGVRSVDATKRGG